MKLSAWAFGVLAATVGCAITPPPVSTVVADREVEEVLATSRQVVVGEGFDLVPSATGLTVESEWTGEGRRGRRVHVACDAATDLDGVRVTVVVEERRRTPGGWAEARVDGRAADRILEAIVEATAETPPAYFAAPAPPPPPPPPVPPPYVTTPPVAGGEEILLRLVRTPGGGVLLEPVAPSAQPGGPSPPPSPSPPPPAVPEGGPEVLP